MRMKMYLRPVGYIRRSATIGVLKATSGNAAKRLGTRRAATRASKNGAIAIQQMATQPTPRGKASHARMQTKGYGRSCTWSKRVFRIPHSSMDETNIYG